MDKNTDNGYESEFESKYSELFAAGEIIRTPDEGLYLMMGGMHPMGLSRIAWHLVEDKLSMQTSDENLERDTFVFLDKITALRPELMEEKVFLLGDAFDTAYEMSYATLLLVICEFFTFPQQCYILFLPSKSCLNYMAFDGELFFR